ncbi:MAG: TonB-dependent receptor [Bacteroidales bacterium]|nr:TonB-dependent receptor [Bacteroidales bacterium]
MKSQKYLIYLLLLLFGTSSLGAQNFTLKGTVRDSETNAPLAFASVLVIENNKGASSAADGHYSLTLAPDDYTLKVSYLGYTDREINISISRNQSKNIFLTSTVYTAQEVTIGGVRTDKNVQQSRMSIVKISPKTLKSIPAFMGEVDILKTIQLMPGVQSGGEGSTGFYVRGGGPDQNLVLLDGATIYNASHLFGFFSVFNADAIDNVELYKGGMPAEYGGRISSILDIDMQEGDMQEFKGSGGIGTIATRLTLQGPIKKDTASFLFSARRTYIDALVMPFVKDDSPYKGSSYFFYDLNGKITYRLNANNTLFFSAYYGKDKFSFVQKDNGINLDMPWGNGMASVRWNHRYNDKLFSNFSLSLTAYEFSTTTSITTDAETQESNSFEQYSGIRDYGAQLNQTWVPNEKHIVKYGASYTLHQFTPNTLNSDAPGFEDIGEGVKQYAHESGLYIGDDWQINSRLTLYGGLRAVIFNQFGPFTRYVKDDYRLHNTDTIYYERGESIATYFSLEPRFSMKYSTGRSSSIKASFMRNKQFIHLASLSASTLPTDLWVSSTDKVKPQIGQQYAVGFFKNFNANMFETSVEVYYKNMWNMLEYADGALPGDEINDNVDNYFVFGQGQSYGAEVFLRKNVGKLTGWIGYTYSKTDRQFDDINKGARFAAKYDRTHDLSFTATYQFNKKLDASMVYVYSTGNTTTLPVARYTLDGNIIDEFGPRNWYRLNAYHRMDASLTYHFDPKPKFESSLNFSIYNVYNRHNPYFIYFDAEGNVDDNSFVIQAKQVSLFPMLPSLTWNFSF